MFLIDSILGIAGKVVDRVVPDVNKQQDQEHETKMGQISATTEGERARNYFTPRAMILYSMGFAVVYGVVVQPFAVAFGLPLPPVDVSAPLKILIGLLGL